MFRRAVVPRRAVVLTAALVLPLPAAASAAPTGTSLELTGLKGVRATAIGGTAREGARFVVPFAGTPAANRIAHASAAGLRLRAGRRTVTLTGLRVKGRALSGTVARKRIPLFTLSQAPLTADSRVALRLTAKGRKALRSGLKLRRVPAGKVGSLQLLLAAPVPAPTPVAAPAPAPAVPPATPPVVLPAPTATPVVTPVPTVAPPVSPDRIFLPGVPAGEVRVNAADWAFRGSWLRYLSGGGGRVETSGGASKTADGSFLYPGTGGTYDLSAGWSLKSAGTATFVYPSHGISIALGEPVVELGPTPRVSVVLTDGNVGGLPGGDDESGDGVARRIVFGTLDLSAVTPTLEGDTVTWPSVPVLLTAEGAAPFLAYKAGEPFGQITVRATIPPAA